MLNLITEQGLFIYQTRLRLCLILIFSPLYIVPSEHTKGYFTSRDFIN